MRPERNLNSALALILAIGALTFGVENSYAYSFQPTDAEWSIWPSYCKAKYAWTNIGRSSRFATRVTYADRLALSELESAGIRGLHHFCAGMAWLNRAKTSSNRKDKEFKLSEALRETRFAVERSNQRAAQFAVLAIQLASVLFEQSQHDSAFQTLESALSIQPDNEILYSAIAVFHRRLGDLESAKSILLRGNDVTEGRSAEINYNLGLITLELGELQEAVSYAESAYGLGYPLPGLRTKLEKLGRM